MPFDSSGGNYSALFNEFLVSLYLYLLLILANPCPYRVGFGDALLAVISAAFIFNFGIFLFELGAHLRLLTRKWQAQRQVIARPKEKAVIKGTIAISPVIQVKEAFAENADAQYPGMMTAPRPFVMSSDNLFDTLYSNARHVYRQPEQY